MALYVLLLLLISFDAYKVIRNQCWAPFYLGPGQVTPLSHSHPPGHHQTALCVCVRVLQGEGILRNNKPLDWIVAGISGTRRRKHTRAAHGLGDSRAGRLQRQLGNSPQYGKAPSGSHAWFWMTKHTIIYVFLRFLCSLSV